jgi:tRNA/rRNA methyltransferase
MTVTAAPPPVIVLVRPQLGENIGKAARAMLNFGLTELRLVTPRDGWPNPDAGPASAGADIVLAEAQVFGSLAEAVADCTHIYATTVRKRGVSKPVLTPEAAAKAVRASSGRSAYIFGAERSGLESDDVALAHNIVTVPINPQFASLNLAQAVILLAYEWSKGEALASPPAVPLDPPAPHGELEELIQHFTRDLDAAGYFLPPERTESTLRTLRTALTKTGWSHNDVRMMHGIIAILGRTPRPR